MDPTDPDGPGTVPRPVGPGVGVNGLPPGFGLLEALGTALPGAGGGLADGSTGSSGSVGVGSGTSGEGDGEGLGVPCPGLGSGGAGIAVGLEAWLGSGSAEADAATVGCCDGSGVLDPPMPAPATAPEVSPPGSSPTLGALWGERRDGRCASADAPGPPTATNRAEPPAWVVVDAAERCAGTSAAPATDGPAGADWAAASVASGSNSTSGCVSSRSTSAAVSTWTGESVTTLRTAETAVRPSAADPTATAAHAATDSQRYLMEPVCPQLSLNPA